MNVNGRPQQTIWLHPDNPATVCVIDQRQLPHRLVVEELKSGSDVHAAIADMLVRGAPLIGVTAAFVVYIAALEAGRHADFWHYFNSSCEKLLGARPTAVN